ncbi:GH10396 [Drosophila grimshawi]|uniref:GH10396 n=1 Tax=Drosophila grimshawi TaxID=7222 RepID=B4JEC0_DROGR|nr:GH10396 [Drosophila grimshawi]
MDKKRQKKQYERKLQATQAIWFPWYYHHYGFESHSNRHGGKTTPAGATDKSTAVTNKPNKDCFKTCPPGYELRPKDAVTCPPGYQLKGKTGVVSALRTCNDNALVLQLARLYVVSPERIVLLLAQPQLKESCAEIADVLDRIRGATSNCMLADDNIYAKLADGLKYYKEEVCDGGANKKRCACLTEAHSCFKDLRTDMIECEGPADWYEKRNANKVCQSFNDILDCYYTRGALLCGLEAAQQLRSFAADSMRRAMILSCDVNKRLPHVTDPMPSFSGLMPT